MGWLSSDNNQDTTNQQVHVSLAEHDKIQTIILMILLVLKIIEFFLYFGRSFKKAISNINNGNRAA